MKKHIELTEIICKKHCRFYRPGQKEELSCQGYEYFRGRATPKLVKKWKELSRRAKPPASFQHYPGIEELLCNACGFRRDDCDFMAGRAQAVPCGGYVLLARLIESGGDEVEGLDDR